MIELAIKEYLDSRLSVPVVFEVPENKPDAYVLVEKTGGSRENMIDSATIAIQSCSGVSLYMAALLNEEVKTAMDGITIRPDISRAKRNTDYNFTDSQTKTYRYQAVYDMVYFDS